MATAASQPRILIVLGCTGTGKTKLGIELAQRFNGEIISCDSIQVYEGIPIASNQCTPEEAEGVRQHLLAVVPPWKAMHVLAFRKAAKALISDIASRGKTPVIVGGTFYWLESLLYKTFLSRDDDSQEADTAIGGEKLTHEMELDVKPGTAILDAAPLEDLSTSQLSTGAIAQLTADKISQLSTADLAALAGMLLARTHAAWLQTTSDLLLQHLASMKAERWQEVLQAMNPAAVASVPFVHHILQLSQRSVHPFTPSTSASSSAAAAHAIFSSTSLFFLLSVLDPPSAAKLHPHNTRKLLRALEIFVETGGKRASEVVKETGGMKGKDGIQLNALAVWLDCEMQTLDERLNRRIDTMMARGLLQEAEEMYLRLWQRQQHLSQPSNSEPLPPWSYACPLDPGCATCAAVESRDVLHAAPVVAASPASSSSSTYLGSEPLVFDWERGAGQTLGLKEFRPYFKLKFHTRPEDLRASDERSDEPEGQPPSKKRKVSASTAVSSSAVADPLATCVANCVASIKTRTTAYARVQVRWIRNRIWTPEAALNIPAPPADASSALPDHLSILRLDATKVDAEAWSTTISHPAMAAVESFLAGTEVKLTDLAHLSAKLLPISRVSGDDAAASVPSMPTAESVLDSWQKRTCDVCEVMCNGTLEWTKHLASRQHRTRSTREARKAKQMEQQAEVQQQRQAKKAAAAAAEAATAVVTDAQPTARENSQPDEPMETS